MSLGWTKTLLGQKPKTLNKFQKLEIFERKLFKKNIYIVFHFIQNEYIKMSNLWLLKFH